jgi:hypothetical protein
MDKQDQKALTELTQILENKVSKNESLEIATTLYAKLSIIQSKRKRKKNKL